MNLFQLGTSDKRFKVKSDRLSRDGVEQFEILNETKLIINEKLYYPLLQYFLH